jgi:hypothetical protein
MLTLIKDFFGVGKVIFSKDQSYIRYVVYGLSNCLKIREHFLKYPLLSYKLVYFQIWSKVLDLMVAKDHLKFSGLLKIISLKAHSPKGLSELLISHFPNYTPIRSPSYKPDFGLLNIH